MGKNRNIVGSLFTAGLVGVAGFLIWKYALNEPDSLDELKDGIGDLIDAAQDEWDEVRDKVDWGNFTDVLDNLGDGLFGDNTFGDLFNEPSKGVGDNGTLNWNPDNVKPDDGGLYLELQNALDETWQPEFDDAVADWQESEAMVLTPKRVDVDSTCEPVTGVMVVCNGNFGNTGWVGINVNAIRERDGVIVSSVAKMNEYYLRNADYDHRRYTMCHELGHGFGLPHTDEDPYNSNLGNCLDYTDDPTSNMLPGDVNMDKLKEMYLTKSRRRVEEDGTVVETTELVRR